jgi:hypothetical protein
MARRDESPDLTDRGDSLDPMHCNSYGRLNPQQLMGAHKGVHPKFVDAHLVTGRGRRERQGISDNIYPGPFVSRLISSIPKQIKKKHKELSRMGV